MIRVKKSYILSIKNHADPNHCFVHGDNEAEAVLHLMFISSNRFQLFKVRRLKNHIPIQKELVRLLPKRLYLLEKDDSKILNTG